MMVEGTLYVPPLPFAATVARDINGRIGFGTWPDDTTIPDYLRSFRQNLTPLVADGEYNPYGRSWWGGVPSGWEDDTRTVRSGLCLTTAGLVAYFYGAKVDAEPLAKAMLAMECSYGLHLDMNQGHTGLEFYHVAREEQLPPLALTLDSMWQAEGAVSHADGLRYRGRRMFRSMQLMNFPRFIGRESRDFFYLTARRLVRSGAKRENDGRAWTIPAVARSVFPYPLSTSHQKPDPERPGTRVNLGELDPKLLSPAPGDTSDTRPIVNLPIPSPTLKGLKLWWQDGKAYVDGQPGAPGALLVANGHARSDHAKAAFCVHPGSGHLWYAEVATGFEPLRDGLLLGNVLKEQGCLGPILYWSSASEFLVGARDLSGHPTQPSGAKLGLAYRAHRRTFRLFPDTPVVKQSVWKPLQNNR